jgi:hypothetical protein
VAGEDAGVVDAAVEARAKAQANSKARSRVSSMAKLKTSKWNSAQRRQRLSKRK